METLNEALAEIEILKAHLTRLEQALHYQADTIDTMLNRIAALENEDAHVEIETGLRQYYQGTDQTPDLGTAVGRRKGTIR